MQKGKEYMAIYSLGIDVGSTTVKTVIIDENKKIIHSEYQRHFSKVREAVGNQLAEIKKKFPDDTFKMCMTGSAGLGLANGAGITFVQEVNSAFIAVKDRIPDADVVIELGGEDAKIIFLTGGVEQRMNGSCAGGTGAFIDQMATLLGVTATELDEMSLKAEKIYPIASRCGVFAKSDIQPLLNQGARREDICASIFQAVVDQTVSGLAQGRTIEGKVLFLGGPLSFLKGLRNAFVRTLGLEEGKTQQDRIAHTAPDSHDDVGFSGDILYQHGINRHADDDEKCLEAQGKQRTQIVLSHAARFLAHHGSHRDRGNRSHKVNLNHTAIDHDKDTDIQRPHGNANHKRLCPQANQRPQVHFH